jgi:peptide/nickel transport system substrate-binding protein
MISAFSIVSVSGTVPNANQIIYVSFGGPETTDPAWAYDTASGELIHNIYEPLWMYAGVGTDSYIPILAESWPGYGVNPGNAITPLPPDPGAPPGTTETWYAKIRTGVKWHDPAYGTLTPADVEYTFERGMLMDHTGGPQWMLYGPLLGKYGSSDYDLNKNGKIDESEYLALENDVKRAIESNSTHVWFNLPAPFAPFQQILVMSWGMIMCKQWAINHGCWNGQYGNYTEFLRCYDPPAPGPLMKQPDAPGPVTPGPVAMGTGPYKLKAMNPDPHTGWYTLERFADYWRSWPAPGAGGYVELATHKNVEEWSNRKAQFLSSDPALQADFNEVPRANVPEMHLGGNKDAAPYPGFTMKKVPVQVIGDLFFTYNISQPSDYTPKLGATLKPDLFMDRDLRLAFMYCMNFTQYMAEYWLGEAEQPTTCMPPGTAYYNASKPVRGIDIAKATQHFQAAWGGQVWTQGITVKIEYNTGNLARETVAKMLEDVIEHRIGWPSSATVDIEPTAVPWSTYMVEMPLKHLSAFIVGWMADYPHPHDWFMPFMHSHGDYSGVAQGVIYGLGNIAASWAPGSSYGPPPYTNALGWKVTAINNTYVDQVIAAAVGVADPNVAEKLYNELMDILYAEASQLPLYFSYGRHYERSWIHGWIGTYNENPICPGMYYYVMWKAEVGSVYEVDISATETIVNITAVPSLIQVYHGEMRDGKGNPAKINYTIHVVYKGTGPDVWILIALKRTNTTGEVYFRKNFLITLSAGEDESFSPFTWYENGIDERYNATTGQVDPTRTGVMAEGIWTISLYVSPSGTALGTVTDSNTANNQQDSPYTVKAKEWPIDIDGSGAIDIRDIAAAAKAFGSAPGHPRWNPDADIDKNEKVDIRDIAMIAKQFGKKFLDVFA